MSDAAATQNRSRHGPAGSATAALDRLWGRVQRPIPAADAVVAVLGVSPRSAQEFVAAIVAGSDEATQLLRSMPALVRGLSISTLSVAERMSGSVRGPILWSETMAARSASAGDPGLFVCAMQARAYDTAENRLLVAALSAIAEGGARVDQLRRRPGSEPALLAQARRNGDQARKFLDHRTLSTVSRVRPDRRVRRRVGADNRRRQYRPAVRMLDRCAEPLDAATLRVFCDARTTAQHDLLVAIIDLCDARGLRLPHFVVEERSLVAGPLRYRHDDAAGPDDHTGIWLGSMHIDAPSSTRRLGVQEVASRSELRALVDAALVTLG